MADATKSGDTEAPNLPQTRDDSKQEERESSTNSIAPSPGSGEIGGTPNTTGGTPDTGGGS